jgi:hypothetical protein
LTQQTDVLDRAFRQGLIAEEEKSRLLLQLQNRYEGLAQRARTAAAPITAFSAANDNAGRSTSRFGTVAQQAGFQIGDLATQVSMGGNAMQALAVQGGQLLGAFGPWGAVIGAAVTVVGALAVGLMDTEDGSNKAKNALDDYSSTMRLANQLTGDAAKAAKELATAQRQQAIEARRAAADQAEAAMTAAQAQMAQLQGIRSLGRFDAASPGDTSDTYTQVGVEIDSLRKTIEALETAATKARLGLAEAEQGVGEFGNASDRAAKSTRRQKEEADLLVDGVTEYIGTLKQQTELLRLDSDERARVEAVQRAMNVAMREGNLLTEDQISLIREQIDAQRDLAASSASQQRLEAIQADIARTRARQAISGLGARDQAILTATYDEGARLRSEGVRPDDVTFRGRLDAAAELADLEFQAKASADALNYLGQFGERAFDRIGEAATRMALEGKAGAIDMKDVWLGVLSEIGQEMFRLAAINPLKNALFGTNAPTLDSIGGILGSAFGGMFGGGAGGGTFGFGGSMIGDAASAGIPGGGFAMGGAFDRGMEITPFATGGIVDRPTLFPMAKGMGLMGEAGPEAVMPLTRSPSGHLGVRALSAPRVAAPEASRGGDTISYYTVDARGANDPGAVEAAVARGIALATPGIVKRAMANTLDKFERSRRVPVR